MPRRRTVTVIATVIIIIITVIATVTVIVIAMVTTVTVTVILCVNMMCITSYTIKSATSALDPNAIL